MGCNINFPQVGGLLYLSDIEQHKLPSKSLLSSELKFKVALFHVAQLLQLLSFMSLQPLHPFCQLGRRALYNYCFIYMYHKPKFYISGQNYQVLFLSSHHRISFEIYTTPEAASIFQCQFLFPHFLNFLQRKLGGR